MPDSTSPSDVPKSPDDPQAQPITPNQKQQVAPPKRKRRLWPKFLLGVLLLLVLLVIFAPSIASTSLVRGYVVGKINQGLNGSVEIQNWSIGWTGGIDVTGIKVFDDRKAEVISIARVHTGLSLMDAIRGRYHCGDTVVDEPNLEQLIIYEDGSNNLQKLAKSDAAAKPHAASPKSSATNKPLDLTGHFVVNRMRALVHDRRTNQTLIVTPDSQVDVKVNGLNDPIENTLALLLRLGPDAPIASIKLTGTAKVGTNGVIDLEHAAIDEKLDLASLPLAAANPFLALAGQSVTVAGMANGAIVLKTTGSLAADAKFTIADLKVAGLKDGGALDQRSVVLAAHGNIVRSAAADVSGIDGLTVTLAIGEPNAPMLDAALRDGQLVMPAKSGGAASTTSMLDLLRGGNVAININLPKAYDLIEKLSPAAPPPARVALASAEPAHAVLLAAASPATSPTTQPLPPLKVLDGVATFKLAISRDSAAQKTLFHDGLLAIDNLLLERGTSRYAPKGKPVSLQFAAEMQGGDALNAISVSQFDGSFFGATIKVAKPLALANLAAQPTATGALELAGKIDDLSPVLDTLQGKPAGESFPYHGDFRLTQTLASQGDTTHLTGSGAIDNFRADDPATHKAEFTEKQISLANDLSYDSRQKNLTLSAVKLDMTGSDALHLSLAGSVLGVGGTQAFKDFKLTLGYDLAKLWPIIYATLSPDQQKDLKDAKLAGKYDKVFTVAGSYPADKPKDDALRLLVASGSLTVDLFDGMGVKLEKFDLPIALQNGTLRTLYADRPEGTNRPEPASFNDGKLDLGGIAVQLTGAEPRVTTPKDYKLVVNATINSLLGDSLGKYINPVFVNSKRAEGRLDVTIANCDAVALGEGMKTTNSGSAKIAFSLRDMDIANPLGSLLIGGMLKQVPTEVMGFFGKQGAAVANFSTGQADTFKGEIREAVVTLDKGRAVTDMTLQLSDPSKAQAAAAPALMPLHFKGDIQLSDLKQNLAVSFPSQLLASFIPNESVGKALISIFPAGIPVTLRGTTSSPTIDYGDMGRRIVEGAAMSQLGNVIGGGKADKNDKSDKPQDIVGGLLDALGGDKKKDKKKDK